MKKNKNKHQVHNLIILDESGSMSSIKKTIIQGFNELVQTIQGIEKKFPEQEHYVSLISFNSLGQKFHYFIEPAKNLEPLNDKSYSPNSLTPLFDAMGFSINKLSQYLQDKTSYNVLVTILTDGEENDSQEFSGEIIKKLVEELKEKRWTFTYIGTDHDVEKFAISISINNTMVFSKNSAEIQTMFRKDQKARTDYSRKIQLNQDTSSNYFEDNLDDTEDK